MCSQLQKLTLHSTPGLPIHWPTNGQVGTVRHSAHICSNIRSARSVQRTLLPAVDDDTALINAHLQDVASEMQSIGAQIATLARDSSNVVDLVSNTYSVCLAGGGGGGKA